MTGFALVFGMFAAGVSDAKIIYVNAARPERGSGTSWATAHKYLQEALKTAVSGDQVLIAKGTYYPDDFYADANGQYLNFGDRELSFRIKAGVNLYGGFEGGETSIDLRDPQANPTILSGEIWEVIPTDPSTAGYQRYWSLHVLVLEGSATFDSLTIEKGRANGDDAPFSQGGGVFIEGGTLTMMNCIVRDCLASSDGGGIFGNVNATGCTFTNNRADNEFLLTDAKLNDPANTQHSWVSNPQCSGGAITGNVVAVNCFFDHNNTRARSLSLIGFTSSANGGAISGSSVDVRNCLFLGNVADATAVHIGASADGSARGGAISAGSIIAVDTIFRNNQANSRASARLTAPPTPPTHTATPSSRGGAVFGKIDIVNSVFDNNAATANYLAGDIDASDSRGGAAYVQDDSQLSNSTFVFNQTTWLFAGQARAGAGSGGGAVRADPGSTLPLASCTFLDNTTNLLGTCLSVGGNVRILSNIFWDTATTQQVLIDVDGINNSSARARISNRLFPTPSTETTNIVKGSLNGVNVSLSRADLGDPPGRTILNLDPLFVAAADPDGPDNVWKTADDGVRLADLTSGAIGRGHPLFLPLDRFDLDQDGDTTETSPVDNSNFARVQNSTMDLGAYEFGTTLLAPEIQIEGPSGAVLVDNGAPVIMKATPGVPFTQTFVIRNLGTLPLRNLRISRSGPNSSAFAQAQPILQTLRSGAVTIFRVTVTPVANQELVAKLLVSNNDTDESPFDINLVAQAFIPDIVLEQPAGSNLIDGMSTINYGNVDRVRGQARTFVVKNTGDGDLVISRIFTSGSHAKDFVITNVPVRVSPGGSASFVVTLKPSALGGRSAQLNIESNDPDAESTFLVNLQGTGVEAPEIDIQQPPGTSLVNGRTSAYGSVRIGLSFTKTFTIKNAGSARLTIGTSSITGAKDFSLVKPSATTLNPGASTKFTVRFRPSSTGSKTATVRITSNDSDENPFDLTVTGNGTGSASKTKSKEGKAGSYGQFVSSEGTITTAEGLRYRTLTVKKGPGWDKAGLKVEVSPNLVDWFSGRRHTTVLIDDGKILKVRDNTPLEPGVKRHIRLD